MKKLLPLILTALFPVALSAQIVINSSDFPQIGSLYFEASDTLPAVSIVPGATGANQNYLFTPLHQHSLDSLQFLSPSNFAFSSQVPTAQIAINQLGGYAFAQIGNNKVELVGFAGNFQGFGIPVEIVYSNPQTILQFPTTFGLTYKDTSAFRSTFPGPAQYSSFVDSVRIGHYGTSESTVDAWGTITTPLGQFDVLRNKTVETSRDSIFGKKQGSPLLGNWTLIPFALLGVQIQNPIVNNTTTYDYLSKEKGYFVVRLVIDNTDGTTQSLRYLSAPNVGIQDPNQVANVMVYPNPANEEVNIDYIGTANANAKILDINNREVAKQELVSGTNSINTSSLSSGFYFVQVWSSKGQNFLNTKISVSK
jgi:hypothetical protein